MRRLSTVMLLASWLLLPSEGMAQVHNLELQKQALDIIADFADSLCTTAPLTGSANNLELTGEAKAELSRILKHIAELGLEGAAKYQSSEWQGLLQKDLAEQLNNSRNCKLEVFKTLQEKLLSPTSSSKPPLQHSPPPPAHEVQLFKVESLPSLDARVTALRFFAGDCHSDAPRPRERKYTRRFKSVASGGIYRQYAIYTEITLEYPPPERRIYFTFKAIYQSEDTGVLDTQEERTFIPLDQQSSIYWIRSCGYPKDVGFYMVDVYINEQKVASGSFGMYLD